MTKFEAWVLRWLLNRLINPGKGYAITHTRGLLKVLFLHLQLMFPEDNIYTTGAIMREAVDEIQKDLLLENSQWFKQREEDHENRCF